MIRILFLAANPTDQPRLRSDREWDVLHRALDAAPYGHRFNLIPKFAVSADGLQELLFRHRPQIVHFSGHGAEDGLRFEAEDGLSQRVASQTLHNLFANFRQTVRCVVLNACYSQHHADAIATVIDSVVGMTDAVTDDAALAFATAFYRALANGKTVADAVALGRNQLDLQELDEAHKPCLLPERADAGQVCALDWDADKAFTATTSPKINSAGDPVVGRDVQIGQGDFVSGNKVEYHFHYCGSEMPPASTTPRGIFGLYPFNQYFFGRDKELATLHTLVQTQRNVNICSVITGMGGLGKTQLVAHYARNHVDDYPDGIFWITAANLNTIRPQLADFCVELGLTVADPERSGDLNEQKIAAFKHYLEQHPNALLIFDNVAEPGHLHTRQIGLQLTALTLGGKVIITTRRRKLDGDKFAELPLQRLLPIPARQILTTARPALATDPDLDRLCEQLGYLPLMLNLAAAALKKRGGTIASYLQRLQALGTDHLHSTVIKVNLNDYHQSLTAVLHEQWAMLQDENARLLLRIAGQLTESAVVPTARLGLLAGLVDIDEWERPLSDALEELSSASLVEDIDATTVQLHPLVREFAEWLTPASEREIFRTACTKRMSNSYNDVKRLGFEYQDRGISAVIVDLLVALDLLPSQTSDGNILLFNNLTLLLHFLRAESHKLPGIASARTSYQLWQQLLYHVSKSNTPDLAPILKNLLCSEAYWRPVWIAQSVSLSVEQTLYKHQNYINLMTVIDEQHILSASVDGTVIIWNWQTGEIKQLDGYESWGITVAVLDEQRIVAASANYTMKVLNWKTGEVERVLKDEQNHINTVIVVSDTPHLISASDKVIKMWNWRTGQVEKTIVECDTKIFTVAVVDAQRIMFATVDRTLADYILKVYNWDTGKTERTVVGSGNCITVIVKLDSYRVVTASSDQVLKIWNWYTDQVEFVQNGFTARINTIAVLDEQHIVCALMDHTLQVWNWRTNKLVQTFYGHEEGVVDIAVIDRERFASSGNDRLLKIWNWQSSAVIQELNRHKSRIFDIAAVDEQHLISVSADHSLKIWNWQTNKVKQTLIGHKGWIRSVVVLDTEHVISVSDDKTLKVWNWQIGQVEQTIIGHTGPINDVAVLTDKYIISSSSDCTLKIWNWRTGQLERILKGHEGDTIRRIAVLNDQRIIAASTDHTLKIWNWHTGQVEQVIEAHENNVKTLTVLDNQRVISTSGDLWQNSRLLKIWNFQTGAVEKTFNCDQFWVNDVAVLDPQHIILASSDHTLKLWNLSTRKEMAVIGLDGAPQCVDIVRQSGRILVMVGDAVGSVYCLELVKPVTGTKKE